MPTQTHRHRYEDRASSTDCVSHSLEIYPKLRTKSTLLGVSGRCYCSIHCSVSQAQGSCLAAFIKCLKDALTKNNIDRRITKSKVRKNLKVFTLTGILNATSVKK